MIFNRKKIEELEEKQEFYKILIETLEARIKKVQVEKENLEKELSDQRERFRQIKFQYDTKAEHYNLLKEENQLLRNRLSAGVPLPPSKPKKKYIKTGKYKGVFAQRQEKKNDHV